MEVAPILFPMYTVTAEAVLQMAEAGLGSERSFLG